MRLTASPRLRGSAAVLLVGLALAATGCSPSPSADDQETTVPDDAGLAEAARYADFPVPDDAEVVGVAVEEGQDTLRSFAVRVPVDQVDTVLADAGVGDPVEGRTVSITPVQGVDLAAFDDVASVQDQVEVDGERRYRDVLVARDGSDSALVHVWAYTT